jgi:hypothetical protein
MSISRPSAPLVTVVNRIATSAEHARELLSDRTATSRSDRFTSIVWKNSQNDRSRKSRFRAPNLICAGNRYDKAWEGHTWQDRPRGRRVTSVNVV